MEQILPSLGLLARRPCLGPQVTGAPWRTILEGDRVGAYDVRRVQAVEFLRRDPQVA